MLKLFDINVYTFPILPKFKRIIMDLIRYTLKYILNPIELINDSLSYR